MAALHATAFNLKAQSLILQITLSIGFFCVVQIDANFGGSVGESLFPLLSRDVPEQREFDYFKLALQWPGTYCRRTKRCCASNGCCRGSNSPPEFTIHGLWAEYNDGTWPQCCSGKRFDAKEISTLLDGLNRHWPSLSCGSPKNCHGRKGIFWEHEWEKHGTCASSVTGDEYNYFLAGLNLFLKYNVTEVLREEGYVASNSEKYPLGGIITAIQNAYHVTPEIQCSGDALEELRLCFYKDFKLRECAVRSSDKVYSKSCPKYVSLPEYVSSKLGHSEGLEATLKAAW